MENHDKIYSYKDKQPEKEYYAIFENKDGTHAYYLCTLHHFMRYEALYGNSGGGHWSYTNYDADVTY